MTADLPAPEERARFERIQVLFRELDRLSSRNPERARFGFIVALVLVGSLAAIFSLELVEVTSILQVIGFVGIPSAAVVAVHVRDKRKRAALERELETLLEVPR